MSKLVVIFMLLGLGLQGQVSSLQPKGVKEIEGISEVGVIINQSPLIKPHGSRLVAAIFISAAVPIIYVAIAPLVLVAIVPACVLLLRYTIREHREFKKAVRHNKLYKLRI